MKKIKMLLMICLMVLLPVILTACGSEPKELYSVSIDLNGGTGTSFITNTKDEIMEILTADDAFTSSDGLIFEGIYTDEDLTTKFTKDKIVNNLKLYIKWGMEGIIFELDENGDYLASQDPNSTVTEIVIPDRINSKSVDIKERGWENNTVIETVYVNDNVSAYAFIGCTNLRKVYLTKSYLGIYEFAFARTTDLAVMYKYSTSRSNVVVESGAFMDATNCELYYNDTEYMISMYSNYEIKNDIFGEVDVFFVDEWKDDRDANGYATLV